MAHFFVSYSHKDIDFVDNLEAKLRDAEIRTWIDRLRLKTGDYWKEVIDREIEDAVGIIVVITPAALRSQYVTYEWAYAKGFYRSRKPIIPILLKRPSEEDEKHESFPIKIHPHLYDLQYKDFTNSNNPPWAALINDLTIYLNTLDIPEEISEYEKELRSSNSDTWKNAIEHLQGYEHSAALQLLGTAAQESANPAVRRMAALALCRRTQSTDDRAVRGLSEFVLQSSSHEMNFAFAVKTLGRLNTEPARATLTLLVSKGEHGDTRMLAVQALGSTTSTPEVIFALNGALSDNHMHTRMAAANSLGILQATKSIPILHEKLLEHSQHNEWHQRIRSACALALVRMGSEGIKEVCSVFTTVPSFICTDLGNALNEGQIDIVVKCLDEIVNKVNNRETRIFVETLIRNFRQKLQSS